MMKMEYFILDTLQGRLTLDEKSVRLIQAPPQYNNIPCLTVDNSVGSRVLNSNKRNITVNTHRVEAIETEYEADLRLDLWTLTEKQRQSLIEQVTTCFNQALSDHYQYCTSYMEETCQCIVEDPEYALDKRAIKNQCPDPYHYPYENLWSKYHIDQKTFTISSPYNLDELGETEPILRSRFDISFNYKDYYFIGGKLSENIINQTEDTADG